MDRLMITRCREHRVHARGLPRLEGGAELIREPARAVGKPGALIGARDAELPAAHQDVGSSQFGDGIADDRHAALRLGIELAGVIETQLVDQGAGALGIARTDEATVAA